MNLFSFAFSQLIKIAHCVRYVVEYIMPFYVSVKIRELLNYD